MILSRHSRFCFLPLKNVSFCSVMQFNFQVITLKVFGVIHFFRVDLFVFLSLAYGESLSPGT